MILSKIKRKEKTKRWKSKNKREAITSNKNRCTNASDGGFKNEEEHQGNGISLEIFSGLLGGRARPRTCPFATRICLALKYFHRSNFPQECDT